MVRHLRPHHVLIPLLALLTTLPLLIHGCSCGHDQPFHVQSWLDAAQQFRHGTVYPRWAFSPAWQAGEPRFIFYPPLSWFLGALLTFIFPMNAVPVVFTWIALTGAGFSMYRLASRVAAENAALLCACVYLSNPYMLFNALERGAYAELLAAAWIPLVLLAVLQERPTIVSIAVPLGLVWLTNAPAGVMATYTLVLLGAARLFFAGKDERRIRDTRAKQSLTLLSTFSAGVLLGLALASFYLLPAAYERRYVQVAMAIIPNLRYQDNFLFGKTNYAAHNEITFSVSVLALVLLAAAVAAVTCSFFQHPPEQDAKAEERFTHRISLQLALLVCVIALLLIPASSFIWEHLPNLKYLQFPWRLLTILSAVLAFALAPLASKLPRSKAINWSVAPLAVLLLSQVGSHLYRQGCEANDFPAFQEAAFRSAHGVLPTDEYTPGDADNDVQRTDNPGYWFAEDDPNQPAANTIANPNEAIENYDGPIPFANTVSTSAPNHIVVSLMSPQILVLNLRSFPTWRVDRNGSPFPDREHRDDGLLALPLPAGESTIDVHWHRSWDLNAGVAISLGALIVLGLLAYRSRRIEV